VRCFYNERGMLKSAYENLMKSPKYMSRVPVQPLKNNIFEHNARWQNLTQIKD
jgi:hypothetical protein